MDWIQLLSQAGAAGSEQEAWWRTIALLAGGLLGAGGIGRVLVNAMVKRWEAADRARQESIDVERKSAAAANAQLVTHMREEIQAGRALNEQIGRNIEAQTEAVKELAKVEAERHETLKGFVDTATKAMQDPARKCRYPKRGPRPKTA